MTSVLSNLSFKLTGILSTSSTSVSISNDIERNQVIVATNASVVLQNTTWTELERMICDFAWGTMTILHRWLDQSATVTEVSWLKKEWRTWTTWYITLLAPDILDANSTWAQTLAWTYTFTGNNTFTGDNTHNWAEIFNGKFRIPVVENEIIRDSQFPSPVTWQQVYVDSLNAIQVYNEDTVQWETLDIWTPAPDASETVKGIARLAAESEALAGTNDDSIMTPKKTKDLTNQEINNIPDYVLSNSDYLAWETIADWDSLFVEDMVTFASATTDQLVWDVAGNTRVSIRAVWSWVAWNSLKLSLAKVVSPSVNLNLRIETDDVGKPSGTLVNPNATATIDKDWTFSWVFPNWHIFSTTSNATAQRWYRILTSNELNTKIYLSKINKSPTCTATSAILKNDAWTVIETLMFVWNVATFTSPLLLTNNTYYRIELNNSWSLYTQHRLLSATFPINLGSISYVSWSEAGSNIWDGYNINSLEVLVDKEITLAWVTSDNLHWVTLDNTEASQTAYKWVKITLTAQVSMVTVVKDSDCTATKCYLYNEAWDLLTSASFVAQTATLSYNGLVNWESYYVLAGSDWSSYTSVKQTGATAFPYVVDRMDYIENPIKYSIETNTYTYNDENPSTTWRGWRMLASSDIKIKSVTKEAAAPATKIRVTTDAGSVLWEGDIVWNSVIFNTPISISNWTTFRVETFGWWSFSKSIFNPTQEDLDNISFVGGSLNWVNNANAWNIRTLDLIIDDENLHNITNITTGDTVLIPKQPVHIVLYAWTYGSETVNATNHYKLGYSTNHTTTRGTNLFDWTVWGTIAPAKFWYVSSTLFTSSLLSKTSASYTYKLPDIPRISTGAYSTGQLVKYDFDGITKRLSGLTKDSDYYISNTAGALSTTTGTNKYKIWVAKDTNELYIPENIFYYWRNINLMEAWTTTTEYSNLNTLSLAATATFTTLLQYTTTRLLAVRVDWEARAVTWYSGQYVQSRLLVNWVQVHIFNWWWASTARAAGSIDISLKKWDVLSWQVRHSNWADWTEMRNFYVRYTQKSVVSYDNIV